MIVLADLTDFELEQLNQRLMADKAAIREKQLDIAAELDARLERERQAQILKELPPEMRKGALRGAGPDVEQRMEKWAEHRTASAPVKRRWWQA